MATKRKHKAKSSTALTVRKKRRRRVHKRHRRNPSGGVGELATILMANGKRRRKRRRHATKGHHPVKHRRRRARRNPEGGIGDLLLTVGAAAVGAIGAKYVQNLAAMKLGKDPSGNKLDPAQAKAQASKPLYVAIGAAAPVALGAALKFGAKQHALGNGLIQGGIAHAAAQVIGRLASKAEPTSPLYPLAGALDGEGENLGQLQIAAAADGTKWFLHPERGWLRYFEPHEMHQLRGLDPRDQLGADDQISGFADPSRDFSGLDPRDQLGSFADPARDLAGFSDPARDFSGLDPRDQLGFAMPPPGVELDGLDPRDQLGEDFHLGSFADPARDLAGLGTVDYLSGPYDDER